MTSSAGQIQSEQPNELAYNGILGGSYSFIDIKILNADTLTPVSIVDPEISIMLIIRDKVDKIS